MREAIRLGNEALAQNDLETAKRYFQALLDTGGTPLPDAHCCEPLVGNSDYASRTLHATGETAQASQSVSGHNAASVGDVAWQPERSPIPQNRNKRRRD